MKKYLLALMIVLALAFVFAACEEMDFEHKDDSAVTQDDGYLDAKDRDTDVTCEHNGARVDDCYDACSCCYQGMQDNTEYCVEDCSFLLLKQYEVEHEVGKADYERFTWCTLGCVSMCGEREKDDTCFEECKTYLGL